MYVDFLCEQLITQEMKHLSWLVFQKQKLKDINWITVERSS